MPIRWKQTVVIPTEAGGASLSPGYDVGGGAKDIGVIMPAVWVAAAVSYQVSADGVTYTNLYTENGTEVTSAVAQGLTQSLNTTAPHLSAWRYIKVRSGATGAHVDQTAARTLTFIFER